MDIQNIPKIIFFVLIMKTFIIITLVIYFYRYLYHVMEKISNHGMSRDVVLKVSNKDFLKIHFRPSKNKGALYQIKTWHYSGHSTWLIPSCLNIGTDLISRLSVMQSNLVYHWEPSTIVTHLWEFSIYVFGVLETLVYT